MASITARSCQIKICKVDKFFNNIFYQKKTKILKDYLKNTDSSENTDDDEEEEEEEELKAELEDASRQSTQNSAASEENEEQEVKGAAESFSAKR